MCEEVVTMSDKIKLILKLIVGIAVILGAGWYLLNQFSFIGTKLDQVVLMDLPKIKNALEESSKGNEKIETGMNVLTREISSLGDQAESVSKIESNVKLLTQKINDELMSGITQFGKESEQNIEEISKQIDNLSRQYVKFMKLAEDNIVVSIPPKWVDELPHRKGTIFSLGIGTLTNKLNRAQQHAAGQARSTIAMMLEKKTFNAVKYTIESVGKPSPKSLDDLSGELKKQITEAVKEILADSQVESYWVDPAGYVYALVALPIEKSIEGSKLGVLIETLRLTHQSITEALVQDFKKQLKLELLK
jgi:hypothetical protein